MSQPINDSRCIVIINWVSYPDKEIGAKRWSEFIKSFLQLYPGEVVLISSTDANSVKEYYNNERLLVYQIHSKYPDILTRTQINGLFDKVKYKIALRRMNRLNIGTPYDKAYPTRKELLAILEEISLVKNPEVLVSSGAPFSLLYTALRFAKDFSVTFWADLRDPWTWDSSYGMSIISSKRKDFELRMERKVLNEADFVSVPVEGMRKYIKEELRINRDIQLLPHGFRQEKSSVKLTSRNLESPLVFIYGGTVYDGTEIIYSRIIERLTRNGVLFRFKMFGGNDRGISSLLSKKAAGNYTYGGFIESSKLQEEISNSFAYIAVYPNRYKDFVSSKIYEILSLGIPILLVSQHGALSEFIVRNNFGNHYEPNEIDRLCNDVASGELANLVVERDQLSNFHFDKIASRFLEVLNIGTK